MSFLSAAASVAEFRRRFLRDRRLEDWGDRFPLHRVCLSTSTANGGSINTSGEQQMANITGGFQKMHGIGTSHPWFNTASFSQPVGCPKTGACPIEYGTTIGNVARNAYYGPGYIQDNLSFFKSFVIWRETSLETRFDAYQLSNSPQFASPSSSITSTTFGHVTSTIGSGTGINGIGGGRSLQLGLTYRF